MQYIWNNSYVIILHFHYIFIITICITIIIIVIIIIIIIISIALRWSESRNCGLCAAYVQKDGATLLAGAW